MNHIHFSKRSIGRKCIDVDICILLVATSLSVASDVTSLKKTGNTCIIYSFTFMEPGFQSIWANGLDYTILQIPGCLEIGKQAGDPMLPVKSVKLLLPAMKMVTSITVSGIPVECQRIEKPVYPYQNPVPFGSEPEAFKINTVS